MGDRALEAAVRAIGYSASQETVDVSWLTPSSVIEPSRPLADGDTIVTRAERPVGPHPMVARNGVSIEDGLRRCSLYDPGLDLAVLTDEGIVAGYALFWADSVSHVGLVEPMRVEDDHARQGLASHLLAAGLRGLAAAGCVRLKVGSATSNPVARRLYAGAGFVMSDHTRLWRRSAT